jgi:hypothetical protein
MDPMDELALYRQAREKILALRPGRVRLLPQQVTFWNKATQIA